MNEKTVIMVDRYDRVDGRTALFQGRLHALWRNLSYISIVTWPDFERKAI